MRAKHKHSFGWFSTGRDQAACDLLRVAKEAMDDGSIPANIEVVFVNREYRETTASDRFLELVRQLEISLETASSLKFEPDLRERELAEWRRRFDAHVMSKMAKHKVDTIVLAGYMLVVSPDLCQKYPMVNLHPALPGGPVGTWQEVVDSLVERGAAESGVQIHRVTPDLDQGPALSFCRFTIPAGEDIDEGTLRRVIRERQIEREIPLLLLTLQAIAEGVIGYQDGVPPLDLTEQIEATTLTGYP